MATVTKGNVLTDTARPGLFVAVRKKIDAILNQTWICTMFNASACALLFQVIVLMIIIPAHHYGHLDSFRAFFLAAIGGTFIALVLLVLRSVNDSHFFRYFCTTLVGTLLPTMAQSGVVYLFRHMQ